MKATTRIRFRILLPLLFLTLSVVLAKVGETRRDNIIRSVVARHGFLFEPLPDNVALERFIDYAINAPAWAAAWNMPHVLPISESVTYLGIMRYEAHWWYFLFVLIMWHLVGIYFDKSGQLERKTRLVVAVLGVLYGSFICYTGFKYSNWGYAEWFLQSVRTWGVAMIAVAGVSFARLIFQWNTLSDISPSR